MSEKKKKSCLARLLTTCLILVLIGLVGFNLLQRKAANDAGIAAKPHIYERIATINDIDINGTPCRPQSPKVLSVFL